MFLEVELGIVNTVHFIPIAVALSLYVIHTSNQQLLSMHSRHINIISTEHTTTITTTSGLCLTGLFSKTSLQLRPCPSKGLSKNLWGLLVHHFSTEQMPFWTPNQHWMNTEYAQHALTGTYTCNGYRYKWTHQINWNFYGSTQYFIA